MFNSVAKTWDLICEVFKDVGERMTREDDDIEPLGEVEQALLDGWLKVEGARGCHWIDDAGQYCNEPLSQLPSRSPYCEEHLRRSLTEKGWQRMLERAGKVS